MKLVLNWLTENYLLVIQLAGDLIAILLLILKKNKVVNSPLHVVLSELPSYILAAEKTGLDGTQKKHFVLSSALARLSALSGKSVDACFTDHVEEVDAAIEDILKTPQKKGV